MEVGEAINARLLVGEGGAQPRPDVVEAAAPAVVPDVAELAEADVEELGAIIDGGGPALGAGLSLELQGEASGGAGVVDGNLEGVVEEVLRVGRHRGEGEEGGKAGLGVESGVASSGDVEC